MKPGPMEFLNNYSIVKGIELFNGLKYRFYSSKDIIILFEALRIAYNEYGSLNQLFMKGYNLNDATIYRGLNFFSDFFLRTADKITELSRGAKFMFPKPSNGSTCKRMNLFLRWMVRADDMDFGIWSNVKTAQLIIPVDTHIARICRQLNLTSLKNPSWKMAEDITLNLKKFDDLDPVKYDFSICHIGMRKMKF